jgi:mono/diheme cytochrome c family protein
MPRNITRLLASVFAGLLLGSVAGAAPPAVSPPLAASPEHAAYFEQHVRPLLVQHCYECHSDKSKPLQGNLALDKKVGWVRGGDSGPAIVPGKPDDSLLVKAVTYKDENVQMPPSGKLPEAEIQTLVRWVQMGAPDPRTGESAAPARKPIDLERGRKHWAFQPLGKFTPPEVHDPGWCRTPIDQFVLSKLEAQKLRPNKIVERRKLIRRVYFDLLGLPPKPEEIDAFVADAAPDAYERLLDRLLASPHYGERWGRHWLDLARYAESHGFEQDYDRPNAYYYRDFVIKALNQDLPFDTFVKWQIAGDEYQPENPLAMSATGYLAAGVHATQITANQAEKERYDELDDITRTIGTSMLGLTVGCARCHDHKFDPIPNEDYYRMVSTFTTTVRSDLSVSLDPAGDRQKRADFDRQQAKLIEAVERYEREQGPQKMAAWLKSAPRELKTPAWVVLDIKETKADTGATFSHLDDGSLLVGGPNSIREGFTLTSAPQLNEVRALRIEALPHASLPYGGPGRGELGTFVLGEVRAKVLPADGKGSPVTVKFTKARATAESKNAPASNLVGGDVLKGWSVDSPPGCGQAVILDLEKPLDLRGKQLSLTLAFQGTKTVALGRVRLSLSTRAGTLDFGDDEIAEQALPVLTKLAGDPQAKFSWPDWQRSIHWICTTDPQWQALRAKVQQHAMSAPRPKVATMLISSEGVPAVRLHTQGPDFYDKTYFLTRGDPNMKKGEATPGFLQVMMSKPDHARHWQQPPPAGAHTSYRRHALAEWMTDVDQGAGRLLARVIVNRLWQHHLGRGIVATPSDFGTQGQLPTHPELLDWLARELIADGWHLKSLHKKIMTSAVYMQSGEADPVRLRADDDNRWCWRRPAVRLEAEVIRDAMLATSGLLDETLFGPGTLDMNQKRRSIYFFIKRSRLISMMSLFDAPDALIDIDQRQTTTVAPQALLMLNSDIVRGYAEALAKRVGPLSPGEPEEAIGRAYRIAIGRSPESTELADAKAFLLQQAEAYRKDGKKSPAELALADFCQVLFGLNEFIYID